MADQNNENTQGSNIRMEYGVAVSGLNMDSALTQVKTGELTYALNAALENFDSSSVNYQNEQGNEFCVQFPSGYSLIGTYFINEKNKHIFFLANPTTGGSEIGYMENNDCIYREIVNAECLNFNVNYPIHKVVHKIGNCTTQIYWTDGYNSRRYLDLENIPYVESPYSDPCDPTYTDQLDCNQLKIQPNFNIPQLEVTDILNGGDVTAGTYQFAVQYSDASGNPYTSFYSITNPTPMADTQLTTAIFDYKVGRSIQLTITNLDTTGLYNYYNIAVIKTINNIASVELVGTYSIENQVDTITYTGQNNTLIKLSITDIFEKYPYYDIAQDLTAAQDVLMWDNLTSIDRINYQGIASKVNLLWETYKIPSTEDYANEFNATNLRGYLRDEVYAFEIVFLLKNGKQTDGFHIPGRILNYNDAQYPDIPDTNADFIGDPTYIDSTTGIGYSPYWKIYNTATVLGQATGNPIGNATPHEYGEFAYWESEETYPCNVDVWGELASQKIRHHKFPDVLVSPIFENPAHSLTVDFQPQMQSNAVYPIGVKIDAGQISSLIQTSSLTQEQKDNIAGFKIVRGNRNTNKSIVAKGMLRNVGKYTKAVGSDPDADVQQTLYYPNYPYNDLNEDPFINATSNAYTVLGQSQVWMVVATTNGAGTYEYTDPDTGALVSCVPIKGRECHEFCSLTRPKVLTGQSWVGPANWDTVIVNNQLTMAHLPGEQLKLRNDTEWTLDNSPLKTNNWSTWTYSQDPLSNGCQVCNATCDYYKLPISKMSVGTFPYYTDMSGNYAQSAQGECTVAPIVVGTLNDPQFNFSFTNCPPYTSRRSPLNDICGAAKPLNGFENKASQYRQVFNSPDTSFSQPFLGDILKLENVMYGGGKAHFVPVKGNAKYRLLSREAQEDALQASFDIASGDITAVFTAYQAYLTIYINGITRKNYAQSFNSIASYDYYASIGNNVKIGNLTGIKQRELDLKAYLIPGVQNIGDDRNINNYQRESSVYTKTIEKRNTLTVEPLPFPNKTQSLLDGSGNPTISDYSRFIIGGPNFCDPAYTEDSKPNYCKTPEKERDIRVVSYYASLKNLFPNQWGQIYSYETIDTGYQRMFNSSATNIDVAFGGDTFIGKFAYKTKLPFFLDNRVNAPDDSDIFYDEIGNVGFPKFWHSARSILNTYNNMINIISIKAHNFDCYNNPGDIPKQTTGVAGTLRTFYDGKFYLFAYGIPYFYCESNYNVDLRQAFNDREGNFWPHVSTGIPDDWVQEEFTTIAYDNTYYYNTTFSRQNTENFFSHLPADWNDQLCFTYYPFRVVYSNPQDQNADVRFNNWLVYSPLSLFDFPQNYGNLVSLDGIQNKAILARFENKTLLYNNLLTMNTSNPQAAYLGNPDIFSNTPIDYAETDLGYVGSQNKFLLKIPQGQVTIDAKRGQVFLIQGTKIEEIAGFGSGVNRFMTDHLSFEIQRYFPTHEETINGKTVLIPGVDIDNNFNGIGLHGVYDSKFERVIITKLDYIPIDKDVKYDPITREFYVETVYEMIAPTTTSTSTSLTTTTTTTVPSISSGSTEYQASVDGNGCDSEDYPVTKPNIPYPVVFTNMFNPTILWSDIEYIEVVNVTSDAGFVIEYNGVPVTSGTQLYPTGAFTWADSMTITRDSFDCTNTYELWDVKIKLYDYTELTNTETFSIGFVQQYCPDCITTTTTTTL